MDPSDDLRRLLLGQRVGQLIVQAMPRADQLRELAGDLSAVLQSTEACTEFVRELQITLLTLIYLMIQRDGASS